MNKQLTPTHVYLDHGLIGETAEPINGRYRTLELAGRRGVNTTSVHNHIALPEHTLRCDRGAVAVEFFTLDDLATTTWHDHMGRHNPHAQVYNLLSDHPDTRQSYDAVFSLNYSTARNPDLNAKFYIGGFADCCYDPERAFVNNNFFDLHRHRWYHVLLTWDKPAMKFRLYVNGVLTGAENQGASVLIFEEPGKTVYLGNPSLCLANVAFYDRYVEADEAASLFDGSGLPADTAYQAFLRRRYLGENNPILDWSPPVNWSEQLALPLTSRADLERFYIQGNQDGPPPMPTADGLLVETYHARPGHRSDYKEGRRHIYLWTDRIFEGSDILVTFDFMPLKEHGLSLLLVHASGMQREDFMGDYPLRKTGVMSMVGWEDVRNYQWEFFREMDDVRNDRNSSAVTKNPWQRKLGFGCYPTRLPQEQWHTAQFLKIGNRIRTAINGHVLVDVVDEPFQNNGPTLDFGRVALRAMCRTKLMYRNLRVITGPTAYHEVDTQTIRQPGWRSRDLDRQAEIASS